MQIAHRVLFIEYGNGCRLVRISEEVYAVRRFYVLRFRFFVLVYKGDFYYAAAQRFGSAYKFKLRVFIVVEFRFVKRIGNLVHFYFACGYGVAVCRAVRKRAKHCVVRFDFHERVNGQIGNHVIERVAL